jgi:hypothetical protein
VGRATRSTASQDRTGAVAQGFWSKTCTGAAQHWHLTAKLTDGVKLKPGCAHGAGLAIARRAGKVGAVQWISTLKLSAAGKASAAKAC